MKITNKMVNEYTRLSNIEAGDVFFFDDTDAWGEEAFVKLSDVSEIQCNSCDDYKYLVMSLEKFDVWGSNYDEVIKEVDAELVIKSKEV